MKSLQRHEKNFEEDFHSCFGTSNLKDDLKSLKEATSDKDSIYSNVLLVNNFKSKFFTVESIKKDPQNKTFSFAFEVICYCKYDYFFHAKGEQINSEYLFKSKFIKNASKHAISSLFVSDKIIDLRKKPFSSIIFFVEDLKVNAYKSYRKKEYRIAILSYNEAYSLLKWLEFKCVFTKESLLNGEYTIPVVDEDIIQKSILFDQSTIEFDFYKQYLISILSSLSYCYMELRNFSEAQKCLLEALEISENKIPMLYFRLAQTRIYNRFSREEKWAKSLSDLNEAKRLLDFTNNKSEEEANLRELVNIEIENINLLLTNYKQETIFRNNSNFYNIGLIQESKEIYLKLSGNDEFFTNQFPYMFKEVKKNIDFRIKVLNE